MMHTRGGVEDTRLEAKAKDSGGFRGGDGGSGGSRKFWWGGFEAKTSKIRMSSPKLRLIFRPKSEIQTFFLPKIRWSPKKKKKKKKKVFTKIEAAFSAEIGNSSVFSPKIRWSPKKKKKKKKKKVFTKIETDFSAGFVTFRSVGGDASRNGAELFKIRADFSAKIVTFRLVGGGCIPPIPPP